MEKIVKITRTQRVVTIRIPKLFWDALAGANYVRVRRVGKTIVLEPVEGGGE